MLQIARHTDYAARIVLHLACLGPDAQASIAGIAEQRRLPVFFVRRLIGKLVGGGILASSRGAAGGIRLARPAEAITLLDVVLAMEGPVALNSCQEAERDCPFADRCPVHGIWADATRGLLATLAAARFDLLAAGHSSAHRQSLPDAR